MELYDSSILIEAYSVRLPILLCKSLRAYEAEGYWFIIGLDTSNSSRPYTNCDMSIFAEVIYSFSATYGMLMRLMDNIRILIEDDISVDNIDVRV